MEKPTVSQVWQFNSIDSFRFPEEYPKYADFFDGKDNYGFCFSGGGTRAATCAVGQLRGLHKIGVLEKAKYIASNSGGTWGTIPYIYLNESNGEELDRFFGEYIKPEDMTVENIYAEPPEGSLIRNTTESRIAIEAIENRIKDSLGDESFSQAISDLFLAPHNIEYKSKYFTLNDTSVEEIKKFNDIEANQFLKVTPGRPFHIANGTLHNRFIQGDNPDASRRNTKRYLAEFTPLYAGVRTFHEGFGDYGTNIGGGYVDPFAFDSDFDVLKDEQNNGIPLVKISYPNSENENSRENEFTLADVMGISGSAPSSFDISVNRETEEKKGFFKNIVSKFSRSVAKKLLSARGVSIVKGYAYLMNSLPEANHFSPRNINKSEIKKVEYNVGDGGPVDDLGLMPLLARDVPKIICFCNVQFKVIDQNKQGDLIFDFRTLDPDVLTFFGMVRKKNLSWLPFLGPRVKIKEKKTFQTVFDSADFSLMAQSFLEAFRNGEPLIHEGTHTTIENKHFGIPGGKMVKILWVYNERSKNFEDELNSELKDKLRIGYKGSVKGSNKLKNFPNFKTFIENRVRVIDMFPEQVNLLSNYQTWLIEENEARIETFLQT